MGWMIFAMAIALCAGASAGDTYRVTKYFTGSRSCSDDHLGQYYVELQTDCQAGTELACHSGKGSTFQVSSSRECLDQQPHMPSDHYAVTRQFSTPDCSGEPTYYQVRLLYKCGFYETVSCATNEQGEEVMRISRHGTPDCSSAAGLTHRELPIDRCNSSGDGRSTLTTCVK